VCSLVRGAGHVSEERFAGQGRETVQVLADDAEVLIRDFGEADADTETWSEMGHFSFRGRLGLSDPDGHCDLGTDFDGDGHLDVASAETQVGDGSPERSAVLDMDLDGVLATVAGLFAPLADTAFVRILAGAFQGKIPERFARGDVEHPDAASFGRVRLAHPLHAEVNAICFVGHADDLFDGQACFDSGEFYAGAADVDGDCFLREDSAAAVGAEDANRDLNFFSRLTALSHTVLESSLGTGRGALTALALTPGTSATGALGANRRVYR